MTVFDFSERMTRLCDDVTRIVPELQHIDMDRVLVTASFNRKPSREGIHAAVTPLRFCGGSRVGKVGQQTLAMPPVVNSAGTVQFYILTFYLPRYLESVFEEKLETVTHELWHISPEFDGTLREFDGPCRIHGPTRAAFDAKAAQLAETYLRRIADREVDEAFPAGQLMEAVEAGQATREPIAFLRATWGQLRSRYRKMRALQIARPQMRRIA